MYGRLRVGSVKYAYPPAGNAYLRYGRYAFFTSQAKEAA